MEDWEHWWADLALEPGLAPILAERQRRFQDAIVKEQATSVEVHVEALAAAGFRETGIIWQHLDNMVVMAVR